MFIDVFRRKKNWVNYLAEQEVRSFLYAARLGRMLNLLCCLEPECSAMPKWDNETHRKTTVPMTLIQHPQPITVAAFCLPVIGLQNDCHGQALKYMSLTNQMDYSNPRVRSRPTRECQEICQAILKFREDNKITEEKWALIEQFRRELATYLTNALPMLEGREVHLEIYGSIRNGFGTADCDVDMSLSFHPDNPPWAHYCSDTVMREVAKVLVDYPQTLDERFISAKVPIVRFRGVNMDIEADISYDNRLALHNTSLLSHYCGWDPKRLPAVGVWIKKWAKRCGIGEASKGGLSSYAWIIMLIHYLQNCGTPPFLRRLQAEPYKAGSSPEENVLGWNVYFWKFINPHENQANETTIYDIFVGFLEYYITYFRYRRHIDIIQIRSNSVRASVRPDRWRKHVLCIQDPFELDHNLAQGVDTEMLDYMTKCLIQSRNVFLDRARRKAFLQSRRIVEVSQMDADLMRKYGDYLLHCCTLDKQPPVRHFFRENGTCPSPTSTSSTEH